jgi:hypothetical protein
MMISISGRFLAKVIMFVLLVGAVVGLLLA